MTIYSTTSEGDSIETYKIVTGKEQIHMNDFVNLCQTGYNLRGHKYMLATTRSPLEVQCNFFSQRTREAMEPVAT